MGAGGAVPRPGSGLRAGGEPAGLPDQVEAGRKAEASVGTFSEVLRAGWKAAYCRFGASRRWRGRRTARRGAFGQWHGGGPETRRVRPQITALPPPPGWRRDSWYLWVRSQPARRPGFRVPSPPRLDVPGQHNRWEPFPCGASPPPQAI